MVRESFIDYKKYPNKHKSFLTMVIKNGYSHTLCVYSNTDLILNIILFLCISYPKNLSHRLCIFNISKY